MPWTFSSVAGVHWRGELGHPGENEKEEREKAEEDAGDWARQTHVCLKFLWNFKGSWGL